LSPGAAGSHDSLLVNLLSEDHSRPDDTNQHCVLLEPYGYRWFRVGGLDYLLRRADV
jgi:maltose alpha-D-glucosyltransferase/alpha-amylase